MEEGGGRVKRYAVVPGRIPGNNGDVHYIGAQQLMRLYGVKPEECVVLSEHMPPSFGRDLIVLRPVIGGRYKLPEATASAEQGHSGERSSKPSGGAEPRP